MASLLNAIKAFFSCLMAGLRAILRTIWAIVRWLQPVAIKIIVLLALVALLEVVIALLLPATKGDVRAVSAIKLVKAVSLFFIFLEALYLYKSIT